MKKLALILTAVSGLALSGFAQGTVTWTAINGNFLADTNAQTYSTFAGPLAGQSTGSGSTGFTAGSGTQLFYYTLVYSSYNGSQAAAPTTLTGLSSWSSAGLTATNGTSPNGRIIAVNGSTGASVPWSNGTTNSIMLVGWSANLGSSYSTVTNELANWTTAYIPNAYFGVSATGYINPAAGNPGPTIFNSAANSAGLPINSIASPAQLYLLSPVPEPGTMALAALGGASLLLFRRRK